MLFCPSLYLSTNLKREQYPYFRANISDVLGNEYTVKGLTEGKEYEFQVAAINNAGVGDYSQCSEAIKARLAPG